MFRINDMLSMTLALDWGSEEITCVSGDYIFSVPNIVVMKPDSSDVIAVGDAARKIIHENTVLKVITPLQGFLFTDENAITAQVETIIKQAMTRAPWRRRLMKPVLLVAVPLGMTGLELIGFTRAVRNSAVKVFLIEAPLMTALGTGSSGDGGSPVVIAEIGAGFSQFAIVKNSEIIRSGVLRQGGRDLNGQLEKCFRKKYRITPNPGEITQLRYLLEKEGPFKIGGIELSKEEIQCAYFEVLEDFAELIQEVLAKCSPEMQRELKGNPIILSGGTAQIPGLPEWLEQKTGFRFELASHPEKSVLRGLISVVPELKKKKLL